jgi:hypothetical protein
MRYLITVLDSELRALDLVYCGRSIARSRDAWERARRAKNYRHRNLTLRVVQSDKQRVVVTIKDTPL